MQRLNFSITQSCQQVFFALFFWLLIGVHAWADALSPESIVYRGGVRLQDGEHSLAANERKILLTSLGHKTGWKDLYFNAAGFLEIPQPENFVGGSGTARRLLIKAVNDVRQLQIEKHNFKATVLFSRLLSGIHCRNLITGEHVEIVPVQIDFADFEAVYGDKDVVAAFDVGLVFLHEIVHGVMYLKDVEYDLSDLGECEQYVNAIRRELHLPERTRYLANAYLAGYTGGNPSYVAQLPFIRTETRNGKYQQKSVFLQWEARRVGTINRNPGALIANAKPKDTAKSDAALQ